MEDSCILLSEKSQSEKILYLIPTILLEKASYGDSRKFSGYQGLQGEKDGLVGGEDL